MPSKLVVAGAAALLASTLAIAPAWSSRPATPHGATRGMTDKDLVPGSAGNCEHAEDVHDLHGPDNTGVAQCSHGPDPAPDDVDVRQYRTTGELEAAAAQAETAGSANGGEVYCDGDGLSGPRVQAIYAVTTDHTDRYAS